MEIKSYEDDELEELYQLWRDVARERPNAIEMDIQEFENANLKSEAGEVQCFMAYEGNELIGASILLMRPGGANSFLNFLVPEEDLRNETSKELLERSLEFCREEGESKVQLSPNIYSKGLVDFMKQQGFEKDEDYPSGLWMKKELRDLSDLETPEGINVFAVEDLEGLVSAEDLAEVQVDYANSPYELKEIIDEFEKLDREQDEISYSIAKLEETSEVVGYSRTIFVNLVRGDSIAKNVGLVVKEAHRNKGIGEALLIDSFYRAKEKGYEKMYISTHSENPAQRLYRKVGFELERKHPNLSYKL